MVPFPPHPLLAVMGMFTPMLLLNGERGAPTLLDGALGSLSWGAPSPWQMVFKVPSNPTVLWFCGSGSCLGFPASGRGSRRAEIPGMGCSVLLG